jgi:hypothetical protein
MKVYKIRNSEGLHSTGGISMRWMKNGKTWVALQHINSHINMVRKEVGRRRDHRYITFPYIGCVIIEYEVTESNITPIL